MAPNPDPSIQAGAERRLVDDREDADGAGLDEPGQPVPRRALADPQPARQLGVAHPPVELERGDQLAIEGVQRHPQRSYGIAAESAIRLRLDSGSVPLEWGLP